MNFTAYSRQVRKDDPAPDDCRPPSVVSACFVTNSQINAFRRKYLSGMLIRYPAGSSYKHHISGKRGSTSSSKSVGGNHRQPLQREQITLIRVIGLSAQLSNQHHQLEQNKPESKNKAEEK